MILVPTCFGTKTLPRTRKGKGLPTATAEEMLWHGECLAIGWLGFGGGGGHIYAGKHLKLAMGRLLGFKCILNAWLAGWLAAG